MTQGYTTTPIKHTILDASLHTDTVKAVPNAGDIISASGAGTWNAYGIGTTGQVLTVLGATVGWQTPSTGVGTHNLLSATHPDTTAFSPPNPGNMITASGASWADYSKGVTGQFLRVLGTTIGWQGLVQGDLPVHWIDGPQHTVSPQQTGEFFVTTGATSFTFQPVPFSVEGTMLGPVSGTNIFAWRAPYAATVTAVWGIEDVGTASQFTARRRSGGVLTYHLPSGAKTITANTWASGGPVQNTAYTIGDSLELVVASGAFGTSTMMGIQVDLTRP